MSTNDPNKLVITEGDIQSARTIAVSEQMKASEQYALVRQVGDASSAPRGGVTALAVAILAGGGVVGGLMAFLGNKFSDQVVNWDNQESWVVNLTFTFIMAFMIGLTLVLFDAASQRTFSKLGLPLAIGAPVAVVAGLALGFVAHSIYSPWVGSIYEAAQRQIDLGLIINQEQYETFVKGRLHWARGVAWSIVGISAGVTIGAASRSLRRLLITTGGGFVGGFLGGFVFDFFNGEGSAQIAGMIMTGLLIGLAMALLEQASKTRWIEIVSGGMAGKQFILYKNDLTIGSSARADITLIKDPAVPELAARLVIQGNRAVLHAMTTSHVTVDGNVGTSMALADGSQMTIGGSVIRYRERSAKGSAPTGGPVRLS